MEQLTSTTASMMHLLGQLHLDTALLRIRMEAAWEEYYLAVDRWEADPTDEWHERMLDLGKAAEVTQAQYYQACEDQRNDDRQWSAENALEQKTEQF